ncbi:DNA-damage-inducible protein [Nostocaceae cyanobacterium CENA369]|uniref:DNA-damage-inducible protein n=1 Tax=Dendronalium phyllosphericum CENA369 TaxID=1725256 RepID=A0A8J7I673_9NOST|nr:BRO family protein [Dendronalium phyllosphericum]MBH8573042.1 DNA-damage-inducible protein [Dendronalium phyllosphericum CENA369]
MKLTTSTQANTDSPFDQIKKIDEQGNEYWLATELLTLLGYQTWKRIKDTVERAKISAKNSGIDPFHHLVDVVQMAQIGNSQAFREVLKDYKLSRHACYLVAMNGDPRKPEIAAAQNYFALKTREAELASQSQELLSQLLEKIEQHNKVIEEQGRAIAVLQSQIQNLLPPSADFIPPGWDAEVWRSLPPQDKRHFRFLFRRRNFRPSTKNESLALPAVTTGQMKQKQRDEVAQLIGEVSPEDKQQFQAAKRQKLKEFWSQAPEEDQENMPF